MTYDDDDDAVSRLNISIEDCKGDYVILIERQVLSDCAGADGGSSPTSSSSYGGSIWRWTKRVLVVIFVVVFGVSFFKWIGPFLMNKEIIPVLNWETETFNKPVLAVLIFASVALFPTILLPSTPSMWVTGMTFSYGFGFLLIIGGISIGASLPYFFGSLFYHKIEAWLERYLKKALILRLAGEGNWFNQFRAVMLLRISPFPYVVYNYCAVATGVKFAVLDWNVGWDGSGDFHSNIHGYNDQNVSGCIKCSKLAFCTTNHMHSGRVSFSRGYNHRCHSFCEKTTQ